MRNDYCALYHASDTLFHEVFHICDYPNHVDCGDRPKPGETTTTKRPTTTKTSKPSLRIYEVCTDDLPTIAESAGVVSIPTIQLYYDGVCYETIVGCVTKNVLSTAIDKMLDDLGLLDDDEDG